MTPIRQPGGPRERKVGAAAWRVYPHDRVSAGHTQHSSDPPTKADSQQKCQATEAHVLQRGGPEARRPAGLAVSLGRIFTQFDFNVPFSIFCGLQSEPAVALLPHLQQERSGWSYGRNVVPSHTRAVMAVTHHAAKGRPEVIHW